MRICRGGLITRAREDERVFARMSATKEGVETGQRKVLNAICSWQFKHGRLLLDNDRVPARFEKAGL